MKTHGRPIVVHQMTARDRQLVADFDHWLATKPRLLPLPRKPIDEEDLHARQRRAERRKEVEAGIYVDPKPFGPRRLLCR